MCFSEGTWIRDQNASDMKGYEHILELLHLSGIQRTTALKLIEGLKFEETNGGASIRYLTVVPFFDVSKIYLHVDMHVSCPNKQSRSFSLCYNSQISST